MSSFGRGWRRLRRTRFWSSRMGGLFRIGCSLCRALGASICTGRCCRNIVAPRRFQWSVANGETLTGVTTMRLDAGLDTGPMLLAEVAPIAPEETAADLFESLADVGSKLMVKTLAELECGTVFPVEQDHSRATLAPILTRDDARMDFSRTAIELLNRWRGFQPWPGAFTTLRGKKLIIHRMKVVHGEGSEGVLQVDGDRLTVGCCGSLLELLEVQMEGKKRMAASEFLRGFQVKTGERVGH